VQGLAERPYNPTKPGVAIHRSQSTEDQLGDPLLRGGCDSDARQNWVDRGSQLIDIFGRDLDPDDEETCALLRWDETGSLNREFDRTEWAQRLGKRAFDPTELRRLDLEASHEQPKLVAAPPRHLSIQVMDRVGEILLQEHEPFADGDRWFQR
jgi:hypothetical protein